MNIAGGETSGGGNVRGLKRPGGETSGGETVGGVNHPGGEGVKRGETSGIRFHRLK